MLKKDNNKYKFLYQLVDRIFFINLREGSCIPQCTSLNENPLESIISDDSNHCDGTQLWAYFPSRSALPLGFTPHPGTGTRRIIIRMFRIGGSYKTFTCHVAPGGRSNLSPFLSRALGMFQPGSTKLNSLQNVHDGPLLVGNGVIIPVNCLTNG